MTRKAATQKATAARRARIITKVEQRQRWDFLGTLVARDLPFAQLVSECAKRFRMSEAAVERLRARILSKWATEDRSLTGFRKAQARRRLIDLIDTATRNKNWSAVVAAENLLAKIDGIITPRAIEVTVDNDVSHAMAQCLAEMTPEYTEEILREQRELHRDAEAWRTHSAKIRGSETPAATISSGRNGTAGS
jgi:hypothetical protein